MREIIIRNIDNAPNGKEFFAGISGNFKDFGQTLCELIDNPISNFRAHKRRGPGGDRSGGAGRLCGRHGPGQRHRH